MAQTKIKQCMTKLPFSNKNKIINGNFDIWQRGNTFSSGGFTADRWGVGVASATVQTNKGLISLGDANFPHSVNYIQNIVSNPTNAASSIVYLEQKIEDVRTLSNGKITLSFWAKADATKYIGISLSQSFGTGGSPSADVWFGMQKILLTNVFTKYTITFDVPSLLGKTLGTNNNNHLRLVFWFCAGTNYNSQSGNLGIQSGTFDIAQVQLEEGPVATPFEDRHISEEWLLCLRYYEITRSVAITPTTASAWNLDYVVFAVPKRTTPNITSVQGGAGNGSFNTRTPGTPTPHGVIWGAAAQITIVGGGWADTLYVDAEL